MDRDLKFVIIIIFCLFQEPNNLTNLNSFRYNGIIHKKCVGIEGGKAPEKKGFTVIMKKAKAHVCMNYFFYYKIINFLLFSLSLSPSYMMNIIITKISEMYI